jgi:hypothetical protein
VKIVPFLPTLCCLNNAGPLESNLIRMAKMTIIGNRKIKPKIAAL